MAPLPPTSAGQDSSAAIVVGVIVAGLALLGLDSCQAEEESPATVRNSPATFSNTPRLAPSCSPNYTGCLPVTFDLDCADVWGSVGVVGVDVYGLDADFDGVGCE